MNDQQSIQNECLPVGSQRSAFLLRCTETEASAIRSQAKHEYRSISDYVIAVLDRSIAEGPLSAGMTRFKGLERDFDRSAARTFGPRTALLIRCSLVEADQVRITARRKEMTISSFALHCLEQARKIA
jgi:hypothetical protein